MRQIQQFRARENLSARRLNRIVDTVNSLTGDGFGSSVATPIVPRQITELSIKSLQFIPPGAGSYLVCTPRGASDEPDAIELAIFLPFIYTLSADPTRGITYTYTDINTRTASDGGTNPDETQHLTDPLRVGEVVHAIEVEDGIFEMLGDGRFWGVDP